MHVGKTETEKKQMTNGLSQGHLGPTDRPRLLRYSTHLAVFVPDIHVATLVRRSASVKLQPVYCMISRQPNLTTVQVLSETMNYDHDDDAGLHQVNRLSTQWKRNGLETKSGAGSPTFGLYSPHPLSSFPSLTSPPSAAFPFLFCPTLFHNALSSFPSAFLFSSCCPVRNRGSFDSTPLTKLPRLNFHWTQAAPTRHKNRSHRVHTAERRIVQSNSQLVSFTLV